MPARSPRLLQLQWPIPCAPFPPAWTMSATLCRFKISYQGLMLVSLQVRMLAPRVLRSKMLQFRRGEMTHVTCANFSRQGEIVATYNDEVLPAVACVHPCFLRCLAAGALAQHVCGMVQNIYLFASEGPAVAAQAAGAAQLGSNLRKRGRRRGSSPPSVPSPQTSAPENTVGQEGRQTALRHFPSGPLLLKSRDPPQCCTSVALGEI